MTIRVWVSYAHRNTDDYKDLKKALLSAVDAQDRNAGNELGLSLDWLSDERLIVGDLFTDKIKRMINQADVWVLLLTPEFCESKYICDEEWPLINALCDNPRHHLYPIMLNQPHSDQRDDSARKFQCRWDGQEGSCFVLRPLQAHGRGVTIIGRDAPIRQAGPLEGRMLSKVLASALRDFGREHNLLNAARIADYRGEMLKGRFTPFLGPACCDLPENLDPARPALRARLNRLVAVLGTDGDKDAIEYARSIAACHQVKDDSPVTPLAPEGGALAAFVPMQGHIARMGAVGCAIFGDALGDRHQGLTDTRSYAVDINPERDHAVRFARALFDARAAAGQIDEGALCLLERRANLCGCVGIGGIRDKLKQLATSVFGGVVPTRPSDVERSAWDEFFGSTRRGADAKWRMALAHLEWIGDLLWHTLRFDAPLFPSPDELAFQISLCHEDVQHLARIPLGFAAATTDTTTEQCLSRIVISSCERVRMARAEPSDGSLSFAVAMMLKAPYTEAKPSGSGAPVEERPPTFVDSADGNDLRDAEGSQPLMISSNLDRDVEQRLLSEDQPYEVLRPVYLECSKDRKPRWMLTVVARNYRQSFLVDPFATFDRVVSVVRKKTDDAGVTKKMTRGAGVTPSRLPGALMVRLRGAPLEDLGAEGRWETIEPSGVPQSDQNPPARPDPKNPPRRGPRATPRISERILSSVDFSREITNPHLFPRCVLDLIEDPNRELCFLGHVVDDPDSLVALQKEVWLRPNPKEARKTREAVSSEPFGAGNVPTVILSRMGIRTLPPRLDQVGAEIVATLEAAWKP